MNNKTKFVKEMGDWVSSTVFKKSFNYQDVNEVNAVTVEL